MRFTEIGQQLRAYRLSSGLRADELATRLGVSRAALYRYEKGEVIKLDTVKRLAELLRVSPPSLLGLGVEYHDRPAAFGERLRQLEATADQLLLAPDGICELTATDGYEAVLAEGLLELCDGLGEDGRAARDAAEQGLAALAQRRRAFAQRRPGVIAILSAASIARFLRDGPFAGLPLPDWLRRKCREAAAVEAEHVARLMETEPMGLQFGLLAGGEPHGSFSILRGRERACVAVNPFRADALPAAPVGVAMLTGSDDAVAAHQRMAETAWRAASKGAAGAALLRRLIDEMPQARRMPALA
jgi:transcriptional regulator with XRE-family HTH domain